MNKLEFDRPVVINFDVDDTLLGMQAQLVSYLNKEHGTDIKPEDIKDWGYLGERFTGDEMSEAFGAIMPSQHWKSSAKRVLKFFYTHPDFRVNIVSATQEQFRPKRIEWFRLNAPWFDPKRIYFADDKSDFPGDFIVDDGYHNVKDYQAKWGRILVNMPHNSGFTPEDDAKHKITRINEVEDLIDLFGLREEYDMFEKTASDLLLVFEKLSSENSVLAEKVAAAVLEKIAKKSEFQKLQDNKVALTEEERKEVMTQKAVWHNGPNGAATPAVWKSVDPDTGKATYVTHTHRAYNTAPTLKGAIGRFHNFIQSTAGEEARGLEKESEERTYKIDAEPGVLDRIELFISALKTLGNWGASRDVKMSFDGDGSDRINKFENTEKGKKVRKGNIDTKVDNPTVTITESMLKDAAIEFGGLEKIAEEMLEKLVTEKEIYDIARVVHEIQRHYNKLLQDREDPSWDELKDDDKARRVELITKTVPDIKKISAKKMHDMWMAEKAKGGWKYGEKYDAGKKTHPCIVPWDELPDIEKAKDAMYLAVIKTMTEMHMGIDATIEDKIVEKKGPGDENMLYNKSASVMLIDFEKIAADNPELAEKVAENLLKNADFKEDFNKYMDVDAKPYTYDEASNKDFVDDRLVPLLKDHGPGIAMSATGVLAPFGIASGIITPAMRATNLAKANGVELTPEEHLYHGILNGLTLGLTHTPETVIKDKVRRAADSTEAFNPDESMENWVDQDKEEFRAFLENYMNQTGKTKEDLIQEMSLDPSPSKSAAELHEVFEKLAAENPGLAEKVAADMLSKIAELSPEEVVTPDRVWDAIPYDQLKLNDYEYDDPRTYEEQNAFLDKYYKILQQHPDYQKAVEEEEYDRERGKLHHPHSLDIGGAVAGVGLLGGTALGAAIGARGGKGVPSKLARGVVGGTGGLMLSLMPTALASAGVYSSMDEKYRDKNFGPYKDDYRTNVERDTAAQIAGDERFFRDVKTASEFSEIFEKLAVQDSELAEKVAADILSKIAETNYLQDFIGGIDPTGVATFKNSLSNEKNHAGHKAFADAGGAISGYAMGAAMPAALTGIAALLLKNKSPQLAEELVNMTKGSLDAFNPKTLKRYFDSMPQLAKFKATGGEVLNGSKDIMNKIDDIGDGSKVDVKSLKRVLNGEHLDPNDLNGVKDSLNGLDVDKMRTKSQKVNGLIGDIENFKAKNKQLEDISKDMSEKYYNGKSVSEGGSRAFTALTTLGTGIAGGALNAGSSHMQYDTAQDTKKMLNERTATEIYDEFEKLAAEQPELAEKVAGIVGKYLANLTGATAHKAGKALAGGVDDLAGLTAKRDDLQKAVNGFDGDIEIANQGKKIIQDSNLKREALNYSRDTAKKQYMDALELGNRDGIAKAKAMLDDSNAAVGEFEDQIGTLVNKPLIDKMTPEYITKTKTSFMDQGDAIGKQIQEQQKTMKGLEGDLSKAKRNVKLTRYGTAGILGAGGAAVAGGDAPENNYTYMSPQFSVPYQNPMMTTAGEMFAEIEKIAAENPELAEKVAKKMIQKIAGVGWDLHGYKKEDLDKFYEMQKRRETIDEEAEKYLDDSGINFDPYPDKPQPPQKLPLIPGKGPDKASLIAGAGILGAGGGLWSERLAKRTDDVSGRFMIPGAIIGAGAVMAPGIKSRLNYNKSMKRYEDDLAKYIDDEASKAGKRNSWAEAYDDYIREKYPDIADQIIGGPSSPYEIDIKTPYDRSTNYKLNMNLMDQVPGIYDYITDEAYGDTPRLRNLSVEEIDKIRDMYIAEANKAREENWYPNDPYFEPGVEAFLKKIDALKNSGADTFRLEYE